MSPPGRPASGSTLDVDVLDPVLKPAVDSPLPNGLSAGEVEALVSPLVQDPRVLGLQLTIYDSTKDPWAKGGVS